MGCAYSSNGRAIFQKINDNNLFLLQKKLFKVINIDEEGTEVNQCQMEITDTELILYQKGRDTIRWPIRAIRRYGYELQLFSFECGRQCQTGSGIYAFKCARAEHLYNALQEAVQKIHTAPKNDSPFSLPQSPPVLSIRSFQRGTAVQRMQDNPRFDLNEECNAQTDLPFSFGSMITTSAITPTAVDGIGFSGYANETYLNSPNYMNTTSNNNKTTDKGCREENGRLSLSSPYRNNVGKCQLEDGQNYANMNQISNTFTRGREMSLSTSSHSHLPTENMASNVNENVNYTLLDLETPANNGTTIVTTVPVTPLSKNFRGNDFNETSPPHTPTFGKENSFTFNRPQPASYSSIDFDKTEAFKKTADELNKQQHRYSHSMASAKIQE